MMINKIKAKEMLNLREDMLNEELTGRVERFDELEHLINDKNYSDVSFIVNGKVLEAHKCIVAKRSPVFDAMFKADMTEKRLNTVYIEDIEYEVFVEMLRYMYAGKVNDIQTIVGDLLAAADKYGIQELVLFCSKSLYKNLNVENAVESLILVDRYRRYEVKEKIIEFIVDNSNDIVKNPAFILLTKSPELLYEVAVAIGGKD